ncbi:class I SAM-dependent methyltransferase [Tardiphaga alba]|uniref:Class I SAM-dependent methyltransferase n=1 Tax=Tardiphaga alba TaxID=340268 RepID=A0ABX8A9R1_9BRAD|nr:class I SAM-dependent methyltransferase [Tardiphaga alba]QUS39130.1 class I SAM-dependent methyltransferase [Tardiphaga alba]
MSLPEKLVDKFYHARGAHHAWEAEVTRRADGLQLTIDREFFFHMNPLYEPRLAMQYVVGRYEAAYDALADLKPKSVLEIGCAHGLSTWLMTSYAERVVGLDIGPSRVAVGRHLFPEVEFVQEDWLAYLERTGEVFDVIVSSHGPIIWHDALPRFCKNYINVGYRTTEWAQWLRGSHKIAGRQLSFSTTHWSADNAGTRGKSYWRYFFRRNYLKEARHAVTNGYLLPI